VGNFDIDHSVSGISAIKKGVGTSSGLFEELLGIPDAIIRGRSFRRWTDTVSVRGWRSAIGSPHRAELISKHCASCSQVRKIAEMLMPAV
jgi:hypothetical protein